MIMSYLHISSHKPISPPRYTTLRDRWRPPAFMPTHRYSFPFTFFSPSGPNDRWFYDWGCYVTPKGAYTRLHVDSQVRGGRGGAGGGEKGECICVLLYVLLSYSAYCCCTLNRRY